MQLLSLPSACTAPARVTFCRVLPLDSAPRSSASSRFSARSIPLLPGRLYAGSAPSRAVTPRARGKGDGDADRRERTEVVEPEIVGEDEWDQWGGRGAGARGGARGDARTGAEEPPPGWDSIEEFLSEENVWATKPFWCQPWTIVLTGATVIGMSWAVLHFIFLTLIVSAAIALWWLTFLVAYPSAYKEMVQEERRRRGM